MYSGSLDQNTPNWDPPPSFSTRLFSSYTVSLNLFSDSYLLWALTLVVANEATSQIKLTLSGDMEDL